MAANIAEAGALDHPRVARSRFGLFVPAALPNRKGVNPEFQRERSSGCVACRDGVAPPFDFSMAFQPIVDVDRERVYAYEALCRGPEGQSAFSVLERVTPDMRYAFDQTCRVKAITLAAKLGLAQTGASLSINFMPGAVYTPAACIQVTLKTAAAVGFPTDRLIFEIVESEQVRDRPHLRTIIEDYQQRGFKVAIDDFGAGYSDLNLLADIPTDVIKLDMELIRNVHERPAARAIVTLMAQLAATLGSDVIAEGVETVDEYRALRACGVRLMQGYLIARPAFETLPAFTLPSLREAARIAS